LGQTKAPIVQLKDDGGQFPRRGTTLIPSRKRQAQTAITGLPGGFYSAKPRHAELDSASTPDGSWALPDSANPL